MSVEAWVVVAAVIFAAIVILWLIVLTIFCLATRRAHNGLYDDVAANYRDLKAVQRKAREGERSQASMATSLTNLTDAVGRLMRSGVSTRPSPVVRPAVPVPRSIPPLARHSGRHSGKERSIDDPAAG